MKTMLSNQKKKKKKWSLFFFFLFWKEKGIFEAPEQSTKFLLARNTSDRLALFWV